MWRSILVATWVATAVLTSAQEPEPNVDCSSVSYAFFQLENDCTKFVFCSDGLPLDFECHEDEIWSQEDGACVFGDAKSCQQWSPEVACGNETAGVVLPHPRDCGKFVWCGEDAVELKDCGPGLIFEEKLSECVVGNLQTCESYEYLCDDREGEMLVHPDRCDAFMVCGENNITVELCPEGEIFRIDVRFCVPGDPKECKALPIETMCENRTNQTLMHPDRCESFVYCEDDVSIVEDCPRGKIFNPRNLTCEVGDLRTCELLDQVCLNASVGELREHPSECDIHIDCLEGEIPLVGYCAAGRIWRQDMLLCVPGNQDSCILSPIEHICDNQPYGAIFPHPEDCSIVVECNLTHTNEIHCPPHHIIQATTLDCIQGSQQSCKPYKDMCKDKQNEIVTLPEVCDAFIQCHFENAELVICPPGEIFDAERGKCFPGDNDKCELLHCTESNSVLRHPNFCNVFTRCYNGEISTNFCLYEHIFHTTMKRCTPGDVTSCEYDPLETMCTGRFTGTIYPYPSDQCTDYVLCEADEAKVQSCPQGTVLRPEHLDCIPGNGLTCEVFDIACLDDQETEIIHPSRCNVKIVCSKGILSVEACPEGQIVDSSTLFCIPGICEEPEPVNECFGRPNGVYEYSDCSHFVACTDEEISIEDCPEREIFLSSIGACFPGSEADCTHFPLETMCEGRMDGQTYPHPDNCSQFITCNNDQASLISCERGNIYSTSHRQCLAGMLCELQEGCETENDNTVLQYPDECDLFIECQAGLAKTKACPPEHIITNTTNGECVPGDVQTCIPAAVDDICIGKLDGALLPHSDNCVEFYECNNEMANLRICQPDNIFYEPQGTCVPGNVDDCTIEEPEPENQCVGKADGNYEYNPSDCSRYIICHNEIMAIENCPDREIFQSNMGICFPGTPEGCATYPLETMCEGRADNSVYPYAENCEQFITCQNGEYLLRSCDRGNMFRPSFGRCLAGSSCQHLDMCEAQDDGSNLLYPGTCELFIRCESQLSVANECPPGEIITTVTDGLCVPGDSAACEPSPVDNRCVGQPDETLLPDEDNCDQYYRCTGNIATQDTCSPGNIFHQSQGPCIPGNANGCVDLRDQCLEQPDGILAFPEPSRCDLFLACSGEHASSHSCPTGEILLESDQICVPGNVDNCLAADDGNSHCDSLANGRYPHPQLCYLYVECTDGVLTVSACPANQLFDQDVRDCIIGDRSTC